MEELQEGVKGKEKVSMNPGRNIKEAGNENDIIQNEDIFHSFSKQCVKNVEWSGLAIQLIEYESSLTFLTPPHIQDNISDQSVDCQSLLQ